MTASTPMDPNGYDRLLDATGLVCPMPVLKARRALAQMVPGQRLLVLATDPAAPIDFAYFCHGAGHDLVSAVEPAAEEGPYRFLIRRGDD